MIIFTANTRRASCQADDAITSGSVGLLVRFVLSPVWDGLGKTAVFQAGSAKVDLLLTGDSCTVPAEILAKPGQELILGLYGTDAEGRQIVPTVYASAGRIKPGAAPSGVVPGEDTAPLVAQILAAAQTARAAAEDAVTASEAAEATAQSVRDDADAGAFDGADGNSIWTTTETPMPATGGMAFTQLTGRAGIPPAVGDIIVQSSRYVYQVVKVITDGPVIGAQIGDIKGEQGVADAIWRTTAYIASVFLSGNISYTVATGDLAGRSGATPKAGDLVIGPEPDTEGDPTRLYTIRTISGNSARLDDVGSIRGATGAPGPQGPKGDKGDPGESGDTITSVSRNSSQRWQLAVDRPDVGAVVFPFGEVYVSFLVDNEGLLSAPSEAVIDNAVTNNCDLSAFLISRVRGDGTYISPLEFTATPNEFIFWHEEHSDRDEFRMQRNSNDWWHRTSGKSYAQECAEYLEDQIGDPDSLTTTAKTNLVAAINEVNGKAGGSEVTVSTAGAVTQALDAGKIYHFTGSLTALTITLNAPSAGQIAQYHFDFDCGSTAPTVTLPNTVILPDSNSFDASKHYEVDILNNYGAVMAWATS